MRQAPKIATCCYCGTRAALVLTGKTRHELACSACGAPLHNLKHLRKDHVVDRTLAGRPKRVPASVSNAPRSRKRKRKGLAARVFEEAFDLIEEIFD